MKLPDGFEIDPLDTVYPPMIWTTCWLSERPGSPEAIRFFALAGICMDWTVGLYLVSHQGHLRLVPDAGP